MKGKCKQVHTKLQDEGGKNNSGDPTPVRESATSITK